MKIHVYSRKSPLKQECEDAYFVNSDIGVYGVLDGVTPLHEFNDEHGHNGAYIAANLFRDYFEQLSELDSLSSGVIEANRRLKQLMLEHQVDLSIKHELWSTCIAAVHVTDSAVSFAQLGDCMVLARFADGSVRVLTVNRVNGVSERARLRRERDRTLGVDVPDESFYEVARNRLIYNRWLANDPDGYGVANGMDEAKDYIQSGVISAVSGLTHVLLISDGMFFPGLGLEQAFAKLLDLGLEAYAEQVELAEQAAGLQPDDRTAILLEFNQK